MAEPLTIEVDDAQVRQALAALAERMEDMTPVMRVIAGRLEAGIERAFELEADPSTGTPWQRLSAVTIDRRKQHGHWPGKKLQVSGQLASSITGEYGRDFAMAGTNDKRAKTLNFGAAQGAFGQTARGGPIPWGDIPGRSFVGASDRTLDDVLDTVQSHLASFDR